MVRGAMVLTAGDMALRLLGMGFQVYLSRRLGARGVGLLQLVLAVGGLFFTAGSAGNRTSATYLAAGALGAGRPLRPILTGCLQYSLLSSSLAAAALWLLAGPAAARWVGDGSAAGALRLYALFLPARCLKNVLTGYLASAGRVGILAGSDLLEQLCTAAASLFLLTRWPEQPALAVVSAGGAAAALSFAALLFLCQRGLEPSGAGRPPYRRILETALPLAAADDLRSGLSTAEDLIIPRRLALYAGTADALADYGTVRGMVFPTLMCPAAILFSLAAMLTPEVSRCAAGGRTPRVRYLVRRSLRVALAYGLAAGAALFIGAERLGRSLYRSAEAGGLLRLYAPLVPMLYMDAVVDALNKGLGQHHANARYNALTSLLDVLGLWLLLPRLGLGGYYLSFALSRLVNFSLSLRRLAAASGIWRS